MTTLDQKILNASQPIIRKAEMIVRLDMLFNIVFAGPSTTIRPSKSSLKRKYNVSFYMFYVKRKRKKTLKVPYL